MENTTEKRLFRCHCGGCHYLDVMVDWEPRWEFFCFCLVEEPRNIWQRIKALFTRQSYVSEVMLETDQVEELAHLLMEAVEKVKAARED